jgi:hypothetical protein
MNRDSAAANLARIHHLRTAIEHIRQQTIEMEQELEPLDAWRDRALDQIGQFIDVHVASSKSPESSYSSEEDDYSYSLASDDSDFGSEQPTLPDEEPAKRPRGRPPKVAPAPPKPAPAGPPPMPPPMPRPNIIAQLQVLYRFNPQLTLRMLEACRRSLFDQTRRPIVSPSIPIINLPIPPRATAPPPVPAPPGKSRGNGPEAQPQQQR